MSARIKTGLVFAALVLAAPALAQQSAGIAAAPLTPLPTIADGLASPAESGLQNGLWDDVSFAAWQALLTGIAENDNTTQASPTVRGLVASAIEARAALPGEGPAPASGADIALLRARALLPYVSAARFNLFVASQSAGNRSPALLALQRNVTFTSDPARACNLPGTDEPGAPWTLYCQLLAGQQDAAQVQIDALHESGATDEATTNALRAIDAALADSNGRDAPEHLTLFAARTLGLAPHTKLDAPLAGSLALRAKAEVLAARNDPDAAEQLAMRGYLDPKKLAAVYEAAGAAITDQNAVHGALRRAGFWHMIGSSGQDAALSPAAMAGTLNNLITSGGAAALLGARGAILTPLFAKIQPAPAFGWAAPSLFALAAGQDNGPVATAWYHIAQTLATTLPEAADWQTRMWPIAVAMGVDDAADLEDWVRDAVALPDNQRPPVSGILTLLEARGVLVPPPLWQIAGDKSDASLGGAAMDGHGTTTDPSQLNLLREAAQSADQHGDRQGEVILRGAILVGSDPSQAPVPTVAAFIRALTQAGLNQSADRLTVEALLALLYPPVN